MALGGHTLSHCQSTYCISTSSPANQACKAKQTFKALFATEAALPRAAGELPRARAPTPLPHSPSLGQCGCGWALLCSHRHILPRRLNDDCHVLSGFFFSLWVDTPLHIVRPRTASPRRALRIKFSKRAKPSRHFLQPKQRFCGLPASSLAPGCQRLCHIRPRLGQCASARNSCYLSATLQGFPIVVASSTPSSALLRKAIASSALLCAMTSRWALLCALVFAAALLCSVGIGWAQCCFAAAARSTARGASFPSIKLWFQPSGRAWLPCWPPKKVYWPKPLLTRAA